MVKITNPKVNLSSPVIQAKLKIGEPDDQFEKEADQMADRVMAMPRNPPPVNRKCEECEEEELQMKPMAGTLSPVIRKKTKEDEEIQMKPAGVEALQAKSDLSAEISSGLSYTKGTGEKLPRQTNKFMNRAFGVDFTDVRIHTDNKSAQMNQKLGARAFTHGNDIFFNRGYYNPVSRDGQRLLAHELTHTIQQGSVNNGVPAIQRNGRRHTVVENDTLSEIAEQYGVSAQAIRDANELTSDNIRIGQVLIIPDAAQESSSTPPVRTHTVVENDTLSQLAERYGVTAQAIRDANELTSDNIRVGQVLIIPPGGQRPGSVPQRVHTVVERETLSGIAERYGVSAQAIRDANELTSDNIRIGQELIIPAAPAAPAPTPAEGSTESPTPAPSATTTPATQPGVPAQFANTTVPNVRSLAMHEYATNQLAGNWGFLRRRFNARNRLISEVADLGYARAGAEQTAISNLQARWTTLSANLANARYDPAFGAAPSAANYDGAVADERADIAVLSRRVFRVMNNVIGEFLGALGDYRNSRRLLDEEATEFHRFDSLFAHADVTTLIGAIPHATFTAADIKAFVSQESGDLTNITIAGITGKSRGLTDPTPNPGTFAGLGQHSPGARDEAIVWAASKGVTIPASPDPRTVPLQSVKLSAAYIGRIVEQLLYPNLPNVKPTGIELKKMTFAGYNGGPRHVYESAARFVGRRSGINYTWDDIKNDPAISGQMRNYVSEIVWRLS